MAQDYDPRNTVAPGYYRVHHNILGHIVTEGVSYNHPQPGGPYDCIRDLAIAERLDDYPSDGYILHRADDGTLATVVSLNPDDLVRRDPIPELTDTEADGKGWRRDGGITTFDSGSGIGGDDMVGLGYEARYVRNLIDGTFAVITDRFYVQDLNIVNNLTVGDEGWSANNYGIENQTEFMHCSTLDDIGGTEIYCDYEYHPIDGWVFPNSAMDDVLTEYENACLKLAVQDGRSNFFFMDDYGSQADTVIASLMKPSDRFLRQEHGKPDIVVTVLRDHEPTHDVFGRGMIKFWCRREDTGQEGYVTFGPGGVVKPAPTTGQPEDTR